MVMVYEDNAGFISHYYLMGRYELDADVVVEQTRIAQRKNSDERARRKRKIRLFTNYR